MNHIFVWGHRTTLPLSACAIVDPSLDVRDFPANSALTELNGSWEEPLTDEVIDGRSAQANRDFNVFVTEYLSAHLFILLRVNIIFTLWIFGTLSSLGAQKSTINFWLKNCSIYPKSKASKSNGHPENTIKRK
jgi:hypothetical protein